MSEHILTKQNVRVYHDRGGWIPAKILEQSNGNACYSVYKENEFQCHNFEIARELHANEYRWMAIRHNEDPPCDRVVTDLGVAVGRVQIDGETTVGKVLIGNGYIYAPYFGTAYKRREYDVLIRNC